MPDTTIMNDVTISDVVNMKAVTRTISTSADQALKVALSKLGIVMTDEQRALVTDEIGKNAAMLIGLMEITLP
jgi:hypothetical protein